jgi:hypothetical protein
MATPAHGIGIALTVGSLRAFRSAKNAGPQNMANRSSERQPPLSHSVHTTASGAGFLGIALLGIILLGKVLLGGLKREETRFETGPVTADRMRRRRLFPRVRFHQSSSVPAGRQLFGCANNFHPGFSFCLAARSRQAARDK